MSKKDFEALANELAAVRPSNAEATRYAVWARDVEAVARACNVLGPNFDHGRFTAACRER